MNKTKIEWARGPNGEPGYTWNPIKGLCPVGCWYCYARAIYRRFGLQEKLDKELSDLMGKDVKNAIEIDPIELTAPYHLKAKGSRIFVCSTFELFHPVADQWRDLIFQVIEMDRHDTFIILTKMPERIDRPMPDNVWLGVSMTGPADFLRWVELQKHRAPVRFISAEPMLEPYSIPAPFPDWLIVGRLTGHGKKHDPSRDSLNYIHDDCRREKVPLFMKSNLSGIWPGKLIQEFPR